jgi:hypothetical protein
MARKKTPLPRAAARRELGGRLAALRRERHGERGGAAMARDLGLPNRTWYNYEHGAAFPAEALLRLILLTGARPRWLLDGTGPVYSRRRTPLKAPAIARPPLAR